ncbi:MAG: VCBS repeat-containing protein, partial [Planctomycetes bacterium]|nr:VCBS repeat-containing protein [Planctomycetota bacterium]
HRGDPLNQLVHSEYPKALRAGDLERVVACFAPPLRDWARRDTEALLAGFARVDRSRCVIHNADPPAKGGSVLTRCELRLDGVDKDGVARTWQQERQITAAPVADGWRITAVEAGPATEERPGVRFVEEAAARGLVATNHSRKTLNRAGEMQINLGTSGVAVGDVDGDGDDDVLLVSGDRLRLFRNDGGKFVDVTDASGIVTPPKGECRCAYFGDLDNDGDQDLFVGMLATDNLLFRNLGGGKFQLVPQSESGLRSSGHTSSACFADFDRDGDLDLVIVNGNNMYLVVPDPPQDATNAHPNQFFRNDGTGHFRDATAEVGLGDTRWGLACAVSDIDRDGDLDLFIANDVGADVFYRNRGDGTFENATAAAGFRFHGSSMSAEFADLNGDGWPDLYVSGMASNSRWMLNMPGFPLPAPAVLTFLFRNRVVARVWEMFHGNRLYLNRRDGTFEEVSIPTRTYWLGWAWASICLDYDNDTNTDIYTANGMWTGENPKDC